MVERWILSIIQTENPTKITGEGLTKIKNINCPVLVMHGNADQVIPFSHGQQLFAMVDQPKLSLWVNGAGHLNLLEVAGEEYIKVMGEFIRLIQIN